jgi:hypothetical protein
MGEGTPEYGSERAAPFPLHLHPLADADTLRCKLARASLRGEGQAEGSDARSAHRPLQLPLLAAKLAGEADEIRDGEPLGPLCRVYAGGL